jgi:hypothetical protein
VEEFWIGETWWWYGWLWAVIASRAGRWGSSVVVPCWEGNTVVGNAAEVTVVVTDLSRMKSCW